jgi:hypothetical protein
MVVHRAQPEEMPNLARGGILLPRVQIVFLEIQLLVVRKALLVVVTLRFLIRHFTSRSP